METQNEIIISSWDNLLEELYRDSWDSDIERFRSNYVYRGLADVNYDLKTTLQRTIGDYYHLEYHLLKNFKKYSTVTKSQDFSDWNCLAVGQHHGLPTRLLDWSFSPVVGAHFATDDFKQNDRDGVIWCIDYIRMHELLPSKLRKLLQDDGSKIFTVELLEEIANTLEKFDRISRKEFILFFEPPSLDGRIVNQFALHSVISSPNIILSEYILKNPKYSHLYKRIIIPKDAKKEIRDKLDESNITERVLFPGLDGLSKWLARYYTPKNHVL